MTIPISDLEGATDEVVDTLAQRGIRDNVQLIKAAATPVLRKELARLCGCENADILHLANRSDLARVRGISGVYSDLLEIAGVDTVKELASRRADQLFAKINETNERDKLTTKPPTQSMVQNWIAQAKALPPILSY